MYIYHNFPLLKAVKPGENSGLSSDNDDYTDGTDETDSDDDDARDP